MSRFAMVAVCGSIWLAVAQGQWLAPSKLDGASDAESSRPSCGVLVHFHINKCAGSTVGRWLNDTFGENYHGGLSANHVRNAAGADGKWWATREESLTRSIAGLGLNQSNLPGRPRWQIVLLHHGSPGLMWLHNTTFPKWRATLKHQGCGLVLTTVLRDPIERLISNLVYNKVPKHGIRSFIHSRQNWLSRYLLYGICDRVDPGSDGVKCGYASDGKFTMTPLELDARLYAWLDKFAVIGFADKVETFLAKVAMITGASPPHGTKHVHSTEHRELAASYAFSYQDVKDMIAINKADSDLYWHYRHKEHPPPLLLPEK